MLKDKKIIIIVILVLVYFVCLIPFKLLNKKDLIVYLGSITKVYVKNGEITVDNTNYKLDLRKVKLYFNNKIEEGFLKSENTSFENGDYLYSVTNDNNDLYMTTNGLLAFEGKNEIKVANPEGVAYISETEKNNIKQDLAKRSMPGEIEEYVKYKYDIDSDGNEEIIYDLKIKSSEDNYYTINLISDKSGFKQLDYEPGNDSGKSTSFYKLIDFDSDGIYEIVIYIYNGNNSLSTYKIYSYNNGLAEIN